MNRIDRKLILAVGAAFGLAAVTPPLGAAVATPVFVSPTGRPTSFEVHFSPYRTTGYGRATFGMTPEEVRALIAQDHPAGLASLEDRSDITTGLRTLTVVMPTLAPGPGPATVTYVFGNASKRLAAVNVYWLATGQATPAQRAELVAAGSAVVGTLAGWMWDGTWLGRVIGPNELVVFSGRDVSGGGVEVRLDGVDLDVQQLAAKSSLPPTPLVHHAAPGGPARLRLSFVSDTQHPDVYRIPAGAF
jgi:hypothetical protein